MSRHIIRPQFPARIKLRTSGHLAAFEKGRDALFYRSGLLALGLEIEVPVVVLYGLGGLVGLVVGLSRQQVRVLVVGLDLRGRRVGVAGFSVELLLLLLLRRDLGLPGVDLPQQERDLGVLWRGLAPVLQHAGRIFQLTILVVEGGQLLDGLG